MPSVWSKIYKIDLIKSNDIYFSENRWYEDLAFSQKVILSAKNIGYYNKPLYYYVIRQGSIMNNKNYLRNLEITDAFDDMIYFYKEKGLYKKYYQELEFLAVFHIYISCFTRIIRIKGNYFDRQQVMNKLLKYLKSNFKNFSKNMYLKQMNFSKKTIYILLRLKLYFIIKIIFFFKK